MKNRLIKTGLPESQTKDVTHNQKVYVLGGKSYCLSRVVVGPVVSFNQGSAPG